MRERHRTVGAMERLMASGQIQTGFRRLHRFGMAGEWSIEAGIPRFPTCFTKTARDAAAFGLEHTDDEKLW